MAPTKKGSKLYTRVPAIVKNYISRFRGRSITPGRDIKPVKAETPEDKIRALATEVYGTDMEFRYRSFLAFGLEGSEEDKALAEEQLRIFDETIEKLKREENNKKVEEAAELYDKIKDNERTINGIVDDFNNHINILIDNIEKDEIFLSSAMVKTINDEYKNYNTNLRILDNNIKAYNDLVGKEYKAEHSKINLTEEQIEKIYRGLKLQIKILEGKKFVRGGKENRISKFQDFLANLELYCEDKELLARIISKVDTELENTENKTDKKTFKDAEAEIDAKIAELFEQYKKGFKELNKTINSFAVNIEIVNILEKYDTLTEDEKEKLAENGIEKFNSKIESEYNKELIDAVEEIIIIKGLIDELSKIEYTDPLFNQKFSELEERLNSTTTSEIFENAAADIIYDKTNLKLHIIFSKEDLSKVNNLHIDVVPERVKSILKGKAETETEKAISSAREKLSVKLAELVKTGSEKVDEVTAKKEFKTILDGFTNIPDSEKDKLLTEYINKLKNSIKGKNVDDEIEEVINKLFEEFKSNFKNFKFPVDSQRFTTEIEKVLEKYEEMTDAEKEEKINLAFETFTQKVENEYGKEFINAIENIFKIEDKIDDLSEIEYKNPEFATKYQELLNTIKKYRDSKDMKDVGIEIILDEENQTVKINFHSDRVNDLSYNLVSPEVKEQMQRKDETPPPAEEHPDNEKEKQDAIDAYIMLLEEVKDSIIALNNCNKSIEAAASISIDDITTERIDSVVSLENSAMQFESSIMAKKLELSNARANLRMKHNCYVTSIPEIKNFAMPKVEFGKDYKNFVRYYDEMITIAENKIKDLDKERTAEYTPEDRVATLTNEMKKLVKYIEAVNSLINRRIVAASLEEPIDIVAFLQERREQKKKIREEIKEMLEKEIARRPKVDQATAEKELEEKLRTLYEEWNSQFKISLSSETIAVDDEYFKEKINEEVEKSNADKKYAIAEKLKNEYAEQREQLKTQYEVTSFLTEQILPIMKEIREGAEYEGERFIELCLSPEIKQKLSEIKNNSHASNKNEIIDQATADYLDKILEIIKKEQISQRRVFAKDIERTLNEIEELKINDDFESTIDAKFHALETKYGVVFGRVEVNYDIQSNRVEVRYPHKEYTGKLYGNVIARIEKTLMSLEKQSEYMEYLKNKENTTQPPEITPPEETPQPEPQKDPKKQGKQLDIIIKDNKGLRFYSNEPQRVRKEHDLIMTADAVELTLIKNGLRIKFSENLRAQLQELNAKLSLVNKDNYRSRTSTQIDTDKEEQEITFKKKNFEFDPEKYKIQIRTDRYDKDGKKLRGTDVIYETDITEEVSDRLKSGRTL